jgi:hypothetical protein
MDGDIASFQRSQTPSARALRWRRAGLAAWAIALIVALGALAAWIVRAALADQLSANQPRAALAFDPNNAPALISAAEADIRAKPPRLGAAQALLRRAVVLDPTDARVFGDLGLAATLQGQTARADTAFALAAERSKRELAPDLWRLDHALKAQDYAGVWAAVDILLRSQPGEIGGSLMGRLAPLANFPAAQPALARTLASNPPWRAGLIGVLAQSPDGSATAAKLLTGLQRTANKPSDAETAALVQGLIGQGRFQEAYAGWIQFLSSARLGLLGDLYNGRFRADGGEAPFNWVVASDATGLADLGGGDAGMGLRALPADRAAGTPLVSELLALPAGRFQFTGQMRTPGASAPQDEGFSWIVTCADTGQVLGQTGHLTSGDAWSPIGLAFETPARGCTGQRFSLQRRAALADPGDLPPVLFDRFKIAPVRTGT